VVEQARHGLARDLRHPLAHLLAEALEELLRQEGDVLAPLPQRRDVYGDDVETIEEVLAHALFAHELGERAVGGGDDAHVHLHLVGAAHPSDLLVLESPQQLDLHGERRLSDLVQEQGAAVGASKRPFLF
jgi:hypothetical protein